MVHLVGGVRSPFVKSWTALDAVPAQDLGAIVLREAIERAEVRPEAIDAVVAGNVAGPAEATNIARVVCLRAGLPFSTPAHSIGRNCASGMEAAMTACRMIETGEASLVAALGIESMSRIPIQFSDRFRRIALRAAGARGPFRQAAAWASLRLRDLRPVSALRLGLTDPACGLNMGETAEVLADEFQIDRQAQDRYALRSHRRTVAAQRDGLFDDEVAPIYVPPRYDSYISSDVGPRSGQSMEKLARLRPAFSRDGTVTAGNSSMITDGAVALLFASEARARELGLPCLGTVRGHAVVGCEPRRMGLGPVFATPLALDRAGARVSDLDRVELNEAFAVQVLACQRAFASKTFARRELDRDEAVGELDDQRLNVNGGAIALGHPVGATGARLLLHLAHELGRGGGGLGLATLCVGGGQGQAVVLEVTG